MCYMSVEHNGVLGKVGKAIKISFVEKRKSSFILIYVNFHLFGFILLKSNFITFYN